ncbi:MAG: tetratricopeptide repeat protein [Desulfobulbaceae bacterium]|jgi:predicted TPR repeat methyltransferase|nr:tetratricopeptide repeat protein [Desulfobulbaceae bacterium]
MSNNPQYDPLHALYAQALDLHQQGRPVEAISLYAQVAEQAPDVMDVHYNLGLAYFQTEQFSRAVTAYSRAAELCPDDEDILYNLGLAYKKGNRFVEAEKAYLKALELAPSDPDIRYNLGCCYRDAGEIDAARSVFARLVDMAPDHLPALNNLAYLHHLAGDYDMAREMYGKIVQLDPEHASARYMHSVLIGAPVDVPPPEYIRSLFDHYSHTFEENLINDLGYNLYLDLRIQFDRIEPKKRIHDHCLDLGCGTGLAGEAFRTACRELSGVDLSEKMIEQAAAKQIYTSLHTEEIVTFLRHAETVYDLFVAADVLIYRGDLHPLFEAAARRASPDALFCLSIEKAEEDNWMLQPTGRYAHHPDYVRKTAGESGWIELLAENTLSRREGDQWVRGTVFVLGRRN